MMLTYSMCAFVAPAIVYAAAFPWTMPEPTLFAPAADNWSPAPTEAPLLPGLGLFRRQEGADGKTCGFLSGISESSITCFDTNAICATNTYLGVHGCCNPSSLSECVIPTTCIPATAMSTECTDAACSSNAAIAKCTGAGLGECYKWLFVYPTDTMTQHGCAESGFTLTAQRSWGVSLRSSVETSITSASAPPASTPTQTPSGSGSSRPSIGAIVGGTIGGCAVVSLIAFGIFLWYRRRKAQRDSIIQPPKPATHYHSHSMTEYNPTGFQNTGTYVEEDHKLWQQHRQQQQEHGGVYRPPTQQMPQYPGMRQYGIVEVDGIQRPVEAPT
ncbi:hypothetical protein BKA66DRAFT_478375 [Pyrenochaeta sp. MPI-SDFR-AT-0127]|nr:hypothetical protein BKA66DRAFT_478375 [Pyrenochaeta sp. MPI-SDFR-AT-0127]